MSHDQLHDLARLSAAVFDAEQARLREVLAEESRLRRALLTLEEQHRAAQAAQSGELAGQRSFGGDVLWQGWVSRSRRDLQIELAQVLARKGRMIRDMQKAHGRKQAAEELLQNAISAHEKTCLKRQFELEQSLSVLKSGA